MGGGGGRRRKLITFDGKWTHLWKMRAFFLFSLMVIMRSTSNVLLPGKMTKKVGNTKEYIRPNTRNNNGFAMNSRTFLAMAGMLFCDLKHTNVD